MKDAAAATAVAKEDEEKKEHEDMFGEVEQKHPEANASGEEAFDDTLENLMTIDESAGGASMMTQGGSEKQDDNNKVENENEQSVKKVVRILRFMQLLVEGHFTPL